MNFFTSKALCALIVLPTIAQAFERTQLVEEAFKHEQYDYFGYESDSLKKYLASLDLKDRNQLIEELTQAIQELSWDTSSDLKSLSNRLQNSSEFHGMSKTAGGIFLGSTLTFLGAHALGFGFGSSSPTELITVFAPYALLALYAHWAYKSYNPQAINNGIAILQTKQHYIAAYSNILNATLKQNSKTQSNAVTA